VAMASAINNKPASAIRFTTLNNSTAVLLLNLAARDHLFSAVRI
jgi:hypothetical protein